MKIRPVGAELFHSERHTSKLASRPLRNFANEPKKIKYFLPKRPVTPLRDTLQATDTVQYPTEENFSTTHLTDALSDRAIPSCAVSRTWNTWNGPCVTKDVIQKFYLQFFFYLIKRHCINRASSGNVIWWTDLQIHQFYQAKDGNVSGQDTTISFQILSYLLSLIIQSI
jgi:hypothetical protein